MGRSRGGLTSKIHALVDADGRPVALHLTGGQVHDSREAEARLDAMPEGATLLADKGYDSNAIREAAANKNAWANIPSRSNRKQRCRGAKAFVSSYGVEGTGATGTSFLGMGEASNRIQASPRTAVMFVEIAYDYQSVTPFMLYDNQQIRYTAASNIRDQRDLTNIFNPSPAAPVARCNVFSAGRPT